MSSPDVHHELDSAGDVNREMSVLLSSSEEDVSQLNESDTSRSDNSESFDSSGVSSAALGSMLYIWLSAREGKESVIGMGREAAVPRAHGDLQLSELGGGLVCLVFVENCEEDPQLRDEEAYDGLDTTLDVLLDGAPVFSKAHEEAPETFTEKRLVEFVLA